MSLLSDRNIHDAISVGKMPEDTRVRLVFPLSIFLLEMMPFMFLSQHRQTQAAFLFMQVRYRSIFDSTTIKSLPYFHWKFPFVISKTFFFPLQALTFRNLLDSEESDDKAITAMGILTNFETMMSVIESKEVSPVT